MKNTVWTDSCTGSPYSQRGRAKNGIFNFSRISREENVGHLWLAWWCIKIRKTKADINSKGFFLKRDLEGVFLVSQHLHRFNLVSWFLINKDRVLPKIHFTHRVTRLAKSLSLSLSLFLSPSSSTSDSSQPNNFSESSLLTLIRDSRDTSERTRNFVKHEVPFISKLFGQSKRSFIPREETRDQSWVSIDRNLVVRFRLRLIRLNLIVNLTDERKLIVEN